MLKRIKQYQQLTEGQRNQIQVLHSNGFSPRKLAYNIRVHNSTVARELKRNRADSQGYTASSANALAEHRRRSARKSIKSDERHSKIIADGLLMGWSPEKIELRLKIEAPELALSHATIYRRIATDKSVGGQLYKKLTRFGKSRTQGGKRKGGRSSIPDRVDISQRPLEVAERSRMGDWEGDTVHSKSGYLVTLVERQSRLVLIGRVAD